MVGGAQMPGVAGDLSDVNIVRCRPESFSLASLVSQTAHSLGAWQSLARLENLLRYAYIEFYLKQYIWHGLDHIRQVLWKQQINISIK